MQMRTTSLLIILILICTSFANRAVFFLVNKDAFLYEIRASIQNDTMQFDSLKFFDFTFKKHYQNHIITDKKKSGYGSYNFIYTSQLRLDTLRWAYLNTKQALKVPNENVVISKVLFLNLLDSTYYISTSNLFLNDSIEIKNTITRKADSVTVTEILKNEPK